MTPGTETPEVTTRGTGMMLNTTLTRREKHIHMAAGLSSQSMFSQCCFQGRLLKCTYFTVLPAFSVALTLVTGGNQMSHHSERRIEGSSTYF